MNNDIVGKRRAEALMEEISKMSQEEMIECWNKSVEQTRDIKYNVTADELIKNQERFLNGKTLKKISKL
jgi:hypothetical protein